MVKHLFRPNFTGDKELAKRSRSFLETDKALAKRIAVHVLNTNDKNLFENISMYGRDCITEWGDQLAVKPELMQTPAFVEMMQNLGYKKRMVPADFLSEGGRHVLGEEFALISDTLESEPEVKKFADGLAVHFVPSLTSIGGGHIDCDYQIIDTLKLIYVSHNVMVSESDRSIFRDKKPKNKIKEIAKRHGYEIREYRDYFGDIERIRDSTDRIHELIKRGKGINSIIVGNVLITYDMHPNEKKYLESKGMEVMMVPLGDVSPGAGLRCVYGEFNI